MNHSNIFTEITFYPESVTHYFVAVLIVQHFLNLSFIVYFITPNQCCSNFSETFQFQSTVLLLGKQLDLQNLLIIIFYCSMKWTLVGVLAFLVLVWVTEGARSRVISRGSRTSGSIKIAAFNIEVFGVNKMKQKRVTAIICKVRESLLY